MTRLVIGVTAAIVGVATAASTAQGNFGVRVFAREAENTPSGVVYEYEIRNNGPSPIGAVYVGWRFGTDNFELLQPPLGWTLEDGIPAGSATSPPGWTVEAIQLEHSRRWTIEWAPESPGAALQPGQTLGGFSVRTASASSAYRLGRWSVIFGSGADAAWWLEPFEDPTVPPDTVPPAVAIVDPAANSLVANTVPITVHADDDTHVYSVQFLIDGRNVQYLRFGDPVGPGSTLEYAVSWNTLAFADGSHELGARAFDDAGNEAWATPITVTVDNTGGPPPAGDTEAPVADVVTPIAAQVVGSVAQFEVAASDNVGVSKVQLTIDGAPAGNELTVAPYVQVVDLSSLSSGPHTVMGRALDAAGNIGNSTGVAFEVRHAPAGAAAAWAFDEGLGTTTADATGNGHDGTVTEAPWDPAGHFGGALSFDGDHDYVEFADAPALSPTESFTFTAWIRRRTTGGWQVLFQQSPLTARHWGLYLNPDAHLMFATWDGSEPAGTTALTDTTAWHHVAFVKDGDTGDNVTFYLDGAPAGTAAVGSVTAGGGVTRIAGDTWYGFDFFDGWIDNVRLYDRGGCPDSC